jgi:hypothetical protein
VTIRVPLSRGMFALIDDEDAELIGQHRWCAAQVRAGSDRFYAVHPIKHGKTIYMHRLILNPPEGLWTDHISGDGLDNRRANLRAATKSQNLCNAWNRRNKTGFRGVSWHKAGGIFAATIQFQGRYKWIGSFKDAEEAARAYDAVARDLHGEFARLNFPEAA